MHPTTTSSSASSMDTKYTSSYMQEKGLYEPSLAQSSNSNKSSKLRKLFTFAPLAEQSMEYRTKQPNLAHATRHL